MRALPRPSARVHRKRQRAKLHTRYKMGEMHASSGQRENYTRDTKWRQIVLLYRGGTKHRLFFFVSYGLLSIRRRQQGLKVSNEKKARHNRIRKKEAVKKRKVQTFSQQFSGSLLDISSGSDEEGIGYPAVGDIAESESDEEKPNLANGKVTPSRCLPSNNGCNVTSTYLSRLLLEGSKGNQRK